MPDEKKPEQPEQEVQVEAAFLGPAESKKAIETANQILDVMYQRHPDDWRHAYFALKVAMQHFEHRLGIVENKIVQINAPINPEKSN